ncbi:MAG: pentapeptide repeat-containing protein [Desulfobacterales bacterium]
MKRFLSDALEEYEERDFKDLDLSHRSMTSNRFYECDFHNCNLSEANLKDCRFVECRFSVCNLSLVKFREDCSFVDTVFESSKMVGIDWTAVSWPAVKLASPIQFRECDISMSLFTGLSLKEIAITKCRARDVDFEEADLTQADFAGTDLLKSRFIHTNLTEANFTHADSYSIDITVNRTKNARFSLPEAISLLYLLDIDIVEEF